MTTTCQDLIRFNNVIGFLFSVQFSSILFLILFNFPVKFKPELAFLFSFLDLKFDFLLLFNINVQDRILGFMLFVFVARNAVNFL
jgi:hypothetical protein